MSVGHEQGEPLCLRVGLYIWGIFPLRKCTKQEEQEQAQEQVQGGRLS